MRASRECPEVLMRVPSICVLLVLFVTPVLAQNPTHIGEEAPSFGFGTFANATVPQKTIAEFKGDVVLLCFVRTSCPGCHAIMPGLDKTRRENDRPDFHVFAATNDSVELFRRFLVHESLGRKFDVPTVVRSNANWGVSKLPWAYVIGRDGKVVWGGHPGQGYDKVLKAALAAPDPEMPEGARDGRKAMSLLAKRQYGKVLAMAEKASGDEKTAAFGKWLTGRIERDLKRTTVLADAHLDRGDVHSACEVLEAAVKAFAKTPHEAALKGRLGKLKSDPRCKPWREFDRILAAARGGSPEKVSRRLKPLIGSDDAKLAAEAKELKTILTKPWTLKDAATMGGLLR
jgi:peroxiredoxin